MTAKGKARRRERLLKAAERRWFQRTLRYAQRKFGLRGGEIEVAFGYAHQNDEGITGFIWDDNVLVDTFYRPGPWRYVPTTPVEDDPFEDER